MVEAQRAEENQHQLGCHQLAAAPQPDNTGYQHQVKQKQKWEQTSEGNLFPDMPTTPATLPVSTPKKRGRKPLVREPEPRPDLTKEEMREKLIGIKEIESVTGIRYIRLHVTAKMIIGIRESSGKEFTINLDELYKAYTQCNHFTSPEVKKYIFMGHSPAVALLRYLKNG